MDSLFLVMPAYNEEQNIENTVRDWYPILEGKSDTSRLVIADSGSSDNTHAILEKLKDSYPQLEIYTNCDRQHGPKLIALYKYAIQSEIDYIFQTDSDGQTNPKEFEAFWNMRKSYDAILGNRIQRGDGQSRAFVEKVVCFLVRIFFGVKVPDANAPFRLMRTSIVSKYVDRLPSDYFIPNIMLSVFFSYYDEKVTFKEISFKPRTAGENSINIPRIFRIGIKALGDFTKFKRNM